MSAAGGTSGASARAGGRDRWSPPHPRRPADPEAAVWGCLAEVLDPELPVSLVDLGLVYGLDVEGKRVRVHLTFTATACPCMELIEEDIRDRLQQEPWIEEVGIERVWDPPWTAARVSEAGRRVLGSVGIAV